MTFAGVNLAELSEVQFLVYQARTGMLVWRVCHACRGRYLSAPPADLVLVEERAGSKRPTCPACKSVQRRAAEDFVRAINGRVAL